MLSENPTIEEITELFGQDCFATEVVGCKPIEGRKGHAVAELEIEDRHRNAMGNVMGGAIFTLADFTLAMACNIGEEPTVSVNNNIMFMSGAKGNKLIAVANADKSGRRLGFYTVDVTDDTGRPVARMTATCHR